MAISQELVGFKLDWREGVLVAHWQVPTDNLKLYEL